MIETFVSITNKRFPWYIDEMKGLADGCGLPFEYVVINFLINLNFIFKKKQDFSFKFSC